MRNVIPEFRLPVEAIEHDIEGVRAMGVAFRFGVTGTLTAEALRGEGFGPIVVSVGAEVSNELTLKGDTSRTLRGLDFLWGFRGNRRNDDVGARVVVVGGGNSAMDAARAAITLPQVETVDLVYRRSEAQMPADREEYENAIADGVTFHFLRNPEAIDTDGTLHLRVMELGQPDASGRPRPVPTDDAETLRADTLITSIGERADTAMLSAFGIPIGDDGRPVTDAATHETGARDVYLAGDARTGPSTVVQCIAAGRRTADAIARRADEAGDGEAPARRVAAGPAVAWPERLGQLRMRKTTIRPQPVVTPEVRSGDAETLRSFAGVEHERCLECSYVCNKCVEVCPNRANITVPTMGEALFNDPFQIVHLDAYCNECGNCGHFCPWTVKVPYRDKPTVFSSRAAFDAAGGGVDRAGATAPDDGTTEADATPRTTSMDGWFLDGTTLWMRHGTTITTATVTADGIAWATGADDTGKADAFSAAGGPEAARLRRLFEILYAARPHLFEPGDEPEMYGKGKGTP